MPVMYSDLELHKKDTAFATSSGWPHRLSSICFFRASLSSGVSNEVRVIAVCMYPGETQFERMPKGPKS